MSTNYVTIETRIFKNSWVKVRVINEHGADVTHLVPELVSAEKKRIKNIKNIALEELMNGHE